MPLLLQKRYPYILDMLLIHNSGIEIVYNYVLLFHIISADFLRSLI